MYAPSDCKEQRSCCLNTLVLPLCSVQSSSAGIRFTRLPTLIRTFRSTPQIASRPIPQQSSTPHYKRPGHPWRGRPKQYLVSCAGLGAMAQTSVLAHPHRLVLVSDLDWTMVHLSRQLVSSERHRMRRRSKEIYLAVCVAQVDHSDKANTALLKFNELWKAKLASNSLLIFSTGRSHKLFQELKVRSQDSDLLITRHDGRAPSF